MPSMSHTKAADAHEAAAKAARIAAESHQKGEHKTGLEHADKAMTLSTSAHEASKAASAKSKTAG
ncbi:MAG: hypothetical protein M0002_11640 [Rhodospirillales bacterium]|nr:hypothetical protein [Rhodospirillales bacterium]